MLAEEKFGIEVEKRKRCAIYCRVSTQEQALMGYSLDEQERLLREACNTLNYEIYDVYCDRGISGKNISGRPEMQRMLKDAEDSRFDVILCWKVNRLARNLLDLLEMTNFLQKYNVGIRSYSEPFETATPQGKLLFHMMAAVGEFERGTISQNVKMGMLARAREGKWNGGIVLGYDIVETGIETKGKSTKLEINPKEAEIVKMIFDMYAKGNGYKAIANFLNKNGFKTKKDNDFAIATIREILRNPIYIGKIRYNVRQDWNEKRRKKINPNPILVDGEHEAIIDVATWDKVQFNLSQSQGKPTRIYDGEFPLTGLLRCPKCGAGMVVARTSKKRKDGTRRRTTYYVCGSSKNKGSSVCQAHGIRVEKVNERVFEELSRFMSSERLIKKVVANINKDVKDKITPTRQRMNKLEKDLAGLVLKKQKTIEVYEEGIINKEELSKRIAMFREEEEKIQHELYSYKVALQEGETDPIPYEVVKEVMTNFKLLLEMAETQEQRKKFLHMLIDKITINEKRELDSIVIKINDNLINYIARSEEVSSKDASSFYLRQNLWRREIKLKILTDDKSKI